VATAPMPAIITPSLPSAGWMPWYFRWSVWSMASALPTKT